MRRLPVLARHIVIVRCPHAYSVYCDRMQVTLSLTALLTVLFVFYGPAEIRRKGFRHSSSEDDALTDGDTPTQSTTRGVLSQQLLNPNDLRNMVVS